MRKDRVTIMGNPTTVSVEMALNSRVSSEVDGPHHGRSLTGQIVDMETAQWIGWAAHQVHDICSKTRLRTYVLTPHGNFEYDPPTRELQPFKQALNEVYVPTEADGGLSVLQTLEDLDTRHTGEHPHFDALWQLGNSYQAIALLCAGLKPQPLACTCWSASRWRPSGWPRVRIVSRPRELAFQTIRVTAMAPSWPHEHYYAPGLHPQWVSQATWGDPRTDSDVTLQEAMARFAWSEEFACEALQPTELSQLLWGTCGTTCHDILRGQWGVFKRMTRLYGTPYAAAGGHYYIRTDTARSLAYVIDREGLLHYDSISAQERPTSSFRRAITDPELINRVERALGLPDGHCPQYVVLNDYRDDWLDLEGDSHRWFDLAEGGSMEYCLRMQAYALGLGAKTLLLNSAEKRAALVETCPSFAHPFALIAVGRQASGVAGV